MAHFDANDIEMVIRGAQTKADAYCNLGLIYATGKTGRVDMVAAHKWLNIAAIKGSERAVSLRADLTRKMHKADLAEALRAAREWMTMH
jgi:TPR repeat protein